VGEVWGFIFLMLILKIPIVYLCWVVYWAIKAEPKPPEFAPVTVRIDPEPRAPWSRPRRSRPPHRRGPHGGPMRGYARTARVRTPI
jgi:hypothetical protein